MLSTALTSLFRHACLAVFCVATVAGIATAAGDQPRRTGGSAKPRVAAAPARNTSSAKNLTVNWEAEYGEVLGDLKKTGVLALVLLAGMIVLSFIF